jgi:hypothetical protein
VTGHVAADLDVSQAIYSRYSKLWDYYCYGGCDLFKSYNRSRLHPLHHYFYFVLLIFSIYMTAALRGDLSSFVCVTTGSFFVSSISKSGNKSPESAAPNPALSRLAPTSVGHQLRALRGFGCELHLRGRAGEIAGV